MATLFRVLVVCSLLGVSAQAQDGLPSGIRTGSALPAVSGVDLEGTPISLSSYLGERTLVLSFWSIHCVDCIRELDDLRSIRREFPPGEVTVVAVNTDSGLPTGRIRSFVRRYEDARGNLDVVHLLDRDAAILTALGIQYIPVLVVTDPTGRVTTILTGYSPEDRGRMARAMEQGRVALGAWGEELRGQLRTILRATGPDGSPVEWGSFRVEEGMPLFGLHDSQRWLADAAGRRDRETEARRVEQVVADRLKVSLLRESLTSLGIRVLALEHQPFGPGGIEVPESPFETSPGWKRLYEVLQFDNLYRQEDAASAWVSDEYWAALVGDVDLGRLRLRLEKLNFPTEASKIRLEMVSDFDYKPRSLIKQLRKSSARLQSIQGEYVVYYGDATGLAEELRAITDLPFKVFVEVAEPQTVRVEVF